MTKITLPKRQIKNAVPAHVACMCFAHYKQHPCQLAKKRQLIRIEAAGLIIAYYVKLPFQNGSQCRKAATLACVCIGRPFWQVTAIALAGNTQPLKNWQTARANFSAAVLPDAKAT